MPFSFYILSIVCNRYCTFTYDFIINIAMHFTGSSVMAERLYDACSSKGCVTLKLNFRLKVTYAWLIMKAINLVMIVSRYRMPDAGSILIKNRPWSSVWRYEPQAPGNFAYGLKIEVKLLLSANSKLYMPCRLEQQQITLSDIEWSFYASRATSASMELLVL